MPDQTDIPRFPDIAPDKITKRASHEIENDDIRSEEEVERLIHLMYEHPERSYYLFVEKGASINEFIKRTIDSDRLLATETEFYYYRHPKLVRDFVRIRERTIRFDWEREVLNTQPMFRRLTLSLLERARRHLEIEQLLNAQSERNRSPWKLEPNFMGFGVDLKKLVAWLGCKLKSKLNFSFKRERADKRHVP